MKVKITFPFLVWLHFLSLGPEVLYLVAKMGRALARASETLPETETACGRRVF